MKITNQNIPPELAALYDQHISTNKIGAGANTRARTRRGVNIPPGKGRAKQVYNDVRAAVEILIERLGTQRGTADFESKVRAEIAAIEGGIWNTNYWKKCEIISTDYLSNAPSSTADNNPPPYGYRDANNMPSIPTYGAGSPDSAPARYAGATSGALFRDTLLVWCRRIYKLATPIAQDIQEPAIFVYAGSLTVAANMRGSRPMLSIILRCYLGDQNSASLSTTANPVDAVPPASPPTVRGCNSFYWRYVIPATTAPFFNTVKLRKILRNLAPISTIDTSGDMTRAVIITAPRPMFGRGFNNNTVINSSLTGAPDIYQIRKPVTRSFYFINANPPWWTHSSDLIFVQSVTYEPNAEIWYRYDGGQSGHQQWDLWECRLIFLGFSILTSKYNGSYASGPPNDPGYNEKSVDFIKGNIIYTPESPSEAAYFSYSRVQGFCHQNAGINDFPVTVTQVKHLANNIIITGSVSNSTYLAEATNCFNGADYYSCS